MITITKERLLTIKQWRETYGPGSNVVLPAEEAEELARIALASMAAVPLVPVMYKGMKLLTKEGLELIRDGIAEATGLEAMCMADALLSGVSVPSVPKEMYWQDAPVEGSSKAAAYATGWNACREAMLQAGNFRENKDSSTNNFREITETSTNSPVTPDGWVMVPKRLTAENGAKGALSGEFSETTFISCPECFDDDDCDTCDGSGRIEIKVPVTWTTIKSIWDKGIAYFAAEPPQEVNRG
ncbi:hypothetical protein BI361_03410 [Salmonella enterica]|nr:hypothetical protein [Salmonella enterica]EBI7562558.1 hypothetical protein [Salmonella enterica]EDX4386381.1 hypothetical protein [Salmonella enterica subsp. enterica serovar O rough]